VYGLEITEAKVKRKKIDIFHIGFEIGIILKGLNGLVEILGGFSLLFIGHNKINEWMDLLTRYLSKYELPGDPNDMVAKFLLNISREFSIDAHHFFIFYLLSHGIIKCFLVYLLWRRKLWAYPLTVVSLILFIAYQLYRYAISSSVFMIYLTVWDILMIFLTYKEYQRIKGLFLSEK